MPLLFEDFVHQKNLSVRDGQFRVRVVNNQVTSNQYNYLKFNYMYFVTLRPPQNIT